MEDEYTKPAEAKDYYTRPLWWSENDQAVNGIHLGGSRYNSDHDSKEMLTPEIPVEDILVNDNMSEVGDVVTSNQDRRGEDIYVAVGNDDLDVVKWVLHHAVSPTSRIFLVHVSPPITLIPTPVGTFPRSQLCQQQVRIYEEDEINRRKTVLQKYIQLCNDAQVTAEALLLESNDTAKAILDLIPIRNINSLVIGIKKPPHSGGRNKLSKGEFVKKNAPEFCDITLVYEGNQALSSQGGHSKWSCLLCVSFSGRK